MATFVFDDSKIEAPLAGGRLDHVSVAVADIEKAVETFEAMGIGPFRFFEYSNDAIVYGKPEQYTLRMALAPLAAGFDLEVIQTTAGSNDVHSQFLARTGGGVEHVGFEVPDLEKAVDHFEKLGCPVILTRRESPTNTLYVDTSAATGLITELIRKGFHPDE